MNKILQHFCHYVNIQFYYSKKAICWWVDETQSQNILNNKVVYKKFDFSINAIQVLGANLYLEPELK